MYFQYSSTPHLPRSLLLGSQAGKRLCRNATILSSQFGSTPADESLSSIRSSTVLGTSTPIAAANMTSSVALVSASKSARKFKNTHTTKSRKRTKQTPLDVNVMTEGKANLHIMSQVQVVLSEGLDLGFLLRCVRYIVNVYLLLCILLANILCYCLQSLILTGPCIKPL